MSRFRVRKGRRARYFPTSTEETTYGTGPYGATITEVNADGSVNLAVDVPSIFATTGTIDGTYAQDPEGDVLEELRARENLRFKSSITRGGSAGQFDLETGPAA